MSVTTTTPDTAALMSFIERASRDPDFDVAKFGELLRIQRDTVRDMQRNAFNEAMAAAQAEMEPIPRRSFNSHTRSSYAKLEAIDREIRPIYTRHGLSVRFGSALPPAPGWMRITCTVSLGGYSEEQYLDAELDHGGAKGAANKNPVQAVGSSVTYLRRYLLLMVFNITTDEVAPDDDGQGAGTGRTDRRDAGDTAKRLAQADAWVAAFERQCEGATTREEAQEILGKESVVRIEDEDAKLTAGQRQRARAARDALRARLLVDERPGGDLEIAGEANLAAG